MVVVLVTGTIGVMGGDVGVVVALVVVALVVVGLVVVGLVVVVVVVVVVAVVDVVVVVEEGSAGSSPKLY